MRMQEHRNPIHFFLMVGTLLLFFLWPSQRAWAVKNAENTAVQDLLYQVREEAVGLSDDAEQMETLVRSDTDWQGHATYLELVASHVNRMGKLVEHLQSIRENGSPWQQDAIDRILPLLKDIAANTNSAIAYLNANHSRPLVGNYSTWLRENAESARELSALVSDTIKYGQTRSRLEKLQEDLKSFK